MHPVLVTLPGSFFKLAAPLLICWGLYSLVVAYNRRALATARAETDSTSRKLPADSPVNATLAMVIGIGLFLFASPVTVPTANPLLRVLLALKVFARSVISLGVWTASWQPLSVYSYGVMLGTSLLVGWYITLRYATRQGLAREPMIDCYIFTAIMAGAGSRILYVVTNVPEFRDPETHRLSLAAMLAMRTGGLVAYGGFLGGLLGSWLFARRHGFSIWKWADAAVPSVASGLAITRIGCYLFGCDFGKPLGAHAPGFLVKLGTFPHWSDDRGSPAWLQHRTLGFHMDQPSCIERLHGDFHDGLCFLDSSARTSAPVHPTQIYESLVGLAIFVALVWLWKRRRFEGQIFLAFGVLYGLARSLIEVVRDDQERGIYAGLSTSQIIGLTSAVICLVLYLRRRRTGQTATGIALFGPALSPEAT